MGKTVRGENKSGKGKSKNGMGNVRQPKARTVAQQQADEAKKERNVAEAELRLAVQQARQKLARSIKERHPFCGCDDSVIDQYEAMVERECRTYIFENKLEAARKKFVAETRAACGEGLKKWLAGREATWYRLHRFLNRPAKQEQKEAA